MVVIKTGNVAELSFETEYQNEKLFWLRTLVICCYFFDVPWVFTNPIAAESTPFYIPSQNIYQEKRIALFSFAHSLVKAP